MALTEEGNSFQIDDQSQTLRYVLRNDSLIRLEGFADGVALGMCTEDGEWTGFADFDCVWTKVNDQLEDIPDGSFPMKYQLDFYNLDGQPESRLVSVHEAYDAFLISGLTDETAGRYVKGYKEGDKVVFRGKTYLGVDSVAGYHVYFTPLQYTEEEDAETGETEEVLSFLDELSLDYDADAKTLSSEGVLGVNAGKYQSNPLAVFDGVNIKPWKEVAAAPNDPEIIDFMPYSEDFGYGGMQIYLERNSVEGYVLSPEKLFINVYFDGKPVVFDPDMYPDLEKATADLPINFTNGENLTTYGNCRVMYFYEPVVNTVAVQEVYKDNGKVYGSHYINYEIDEEGYISSAVESAQLSSDDARAKSVSYTDLCGRSVAQPVSGVYLKTVKYADGTQKTVKFVKK